MPAALSRPQRAACRRDRGFAAVDFPWERPPQADGVGLGRIVIRPLTLLSAAAGRVGSGDFDARAAVTSQDEIGRLGAVFHEMTARLATARRELEGKNT